MPGLVAGLPMPGRPAPGRSIIRFARRQHRAPPSARLRGEAQLEDVETVRGDALDGLAGRAAVDRLELDQEGGVLDQVLLDLDVDLLALGRNLLLDPLVEQLVD